MVTLMSLFSFCFGLCRFRFPRWWFGFTVATFRCRGRCAGVAGGTRAGQTLLGMPAAARCWLQAARLPVHALTVPMLPCSMPMVALNPFWLDQVEFKALFYW